MGCTLRAPQRQTSTARWVHACRLVFVLSTLPMLQVHLRWYCNAFMLRLAMPRSNQPPLQPAHELREELPAASGQLMELRLTYG